MSLRVDCAKRSTRTCVFWKPGLGRDTTCGLARTRQEISQRPLIVGSAAFGWERAAQENQGPPEQLHPLLASPHERMLMIMVDLELLDGFCATVDCHEHYVACELVARESIYLALIRGIATVTTGEFVGVPRVEVAME